MADLTITATSVAEGEKCRKKTGKAGETLTAGQAIFIDSADNKEIKKATCVDTAVKAKVAGITLCGAANNQSVVYAKSGRIIIGATLVPGETYVLSEAGAICPIGDLAASDQITRIGVAVSTTELLLDIRATGIEKA